MASDTRPEMIGTRPWRTKPINDRLNAGMAIDENGCWRWQRIKNRSGYGHIKIAEKNVGVHRVAYETWVGPIPDGLEIDHICGVRDCINPEHLEAVTHLENLRRKSRAYRAARKVDPRASSVLAQHFHINGCGCEIHDAPFLNVRDPRCVEWTKMQQAALTAHIATAIGDALSRLGVSK